MLVIRLGSQYFYVKYKNRLDPQPAYDADMPAPTGLRDAKKEETRRQIAGAALRLFLERGFEEVSIAQIAEAAHVSKMTVFNYFPAKESMFFEFAVERLPDLGQAVRERPAGVPPVVALHRYVRAELERRAEWTGFHDGVAEFARVIFSSPTLIEGFGRMWRDLEQDLLAAFTEAAGQPEPVDLAQRLRAVWVDQAAPDAGQVVIGLESVRLRVAVAQIAATLQQLTTLNQLRQSLGITTGQCEAETLAECDAAFDLLENGLSDVTDGPAG
jgi:AcrR family transcriptional regulator